MSCPVTPNLKNRRNSVISKEDFSYRTYQVTPSVVFTYMRKRPTSSYLTRPSTKVSSLPPSTDSSIGPGTYSPQKPDFYQTFQFPRCERFGTKDVNANYIFSKKKSAEEILKISERIIKNKESVTQAIQIKKKTEQTKVKRKNFRAEVAKMVKVNLMNDKKTAQVELTKTKFKKLEYRLRLDELAVIKKAWIMLEVVSAFAFVNNFQITYRKDLRRRSTKKLRLLRKIVTFIAKLMRIRSKIKYSNGVKTIKRYLSFYAMQWAKRRTTIYKKILDKTIQKAFGSIVLSSLIKAWLKNFLKIKRILRLSFFYKISLFQSLLSKWAEAEYNIFSERPTQSIQKHQSLLSTQSFQKKTESEGLLSIPVEIKLFYLRKFINDQIVKYIRKHKRYKENFRLIHAQNIKNRLEFKNLELLEYPKPPLKVNICKEFDLNKLKKVVKFAIKDKAQWSKILYGKAGKYGKEFKRRLSHDLAPSYPYL